MPALIRLLFAFLARIALFKIQDGLWTEHSVFDVTTKDSAEQNRVSLNMAATTGVKNGWLGNLFVKFDPGRGKSEAPIVEDLIRKSGLSSASCDQGTRGILMGPPGAGKGTQVYLDL